MPKNTGDRIDPKIELTGKGMASTPERIEQLEKTLKEHQKCIVGKPKTSFATILEKNQKKKKKKQHALPKEEKKAKTPIQSWQGNIYNKDKKEKTIIKG